MAVVTPCLWEGQAAWTKSYVGHSRRATRRILWNGVMWIFRLPALCSPPRRSPRRTLALEQHRLQTLATQGVRVPTVLRVDGERLILSDEGPTVRQGLRLLDNTEQDALLRQVSEALADAHARGAHLGQPFARNITWRPEQGVAFLDFEEDPLDRMDLTHAQVRDGLLWADSVARATDNDADRASTALRPWVQSLKAPTLRILSAHVHAMEKLPVWGRQGRRVATVRQAFSALINDWGR